MSKLRLKLHVEIRRRNEWEHYDSIECLIKNDTFKCLLVPNLIFKKIKFLKNILFEMAKGMPLGTCRVTWDHFISEKNNAIYCSYINGKQVGQFNNYLKNKELDNKDLHNLLKIFNNLIEKSNNDLQDVRYVFWLILEK